MNTDKASHILWEYHRLRMPLVKADCIFVLSSHDVRVAEHAASLYNRGYAPKLLISGGIAHQGDLLQTPWTEPEAVVFSKRAIELGVPKEDIILETAARNTGENIILSKPLLEQLHVKSLIVVQKPFMERRAYATFKRVWPEMQFTISSPDLTFEQYPTDDIPKDMVINILVGDTQRIIEYPALGFQIPQEMPHSVKAAYDFLISEGFTKHLMKR